MQRPSEADRRLKLVFSDRDPNERAAAARARRAPVTEADITRHEGPVTAILLDAPRTLSDRLEAAQRLEPDFAAMLRLWAQTGMRAGEVSGLQWQDVD